MPDPILHILRQEGLVRRGSIRRERIAALSLSSIVDISDRVAEATQVQTQDKSPPVQHTASLGLGGAASECSGSACRLARIRELARFAALYSDRTYIHNFLSDYSSTVGHPPRQDSDHFRARVALDVSLLLEIDTLLAAGLVRPVSPAKHSCPRCLVMSAFGRSATRKYDREARDIGKLYLEGMHVTAQGRGSNQVHLACHGPSDLFHHGGIHIERYPDGALKRRPTILKKVEAGQRVVLSRSLVREMKLDAYFAQSVLMNVLYPLAVSGLLSTPFLTHRSIHVRALRAVTPARQSDINLAPSAISAMVPFAEDLPTRELVALRNRESESFIRFRAALTRAINERFRSTGTFSDKDAKALYSDILLPELARLDQSVRQASRDLAFGVGGSVAKVVGVLAVGSFAGLIPSELSAAANFIGWSKILADTIGEAVSRSNTRKNLRESDFYYLWEMRHSVVSRSHGATLY